MSSWDRQSASLESIQCATISLKGCVTNFAPVVEILLRAAPLRAEAGAGGAVTQQQLLRPSKLLLLRDLQAAAAARGLHGQVSQPRLLEVLLALELVLQELREVAHVLAGGRLKKNKFMKIDISISHFVLYTSFKYPYVRGT